MKYDAWVEERIKQSRQRLVSAFHLEAMDHVPIWEFTSDPIYPLGMVMSDQEAMLKQALHNIELTLQYKTDFCPVLYPWFGTGVYAEAFGAKIEWRENDYPWSIPTLSDPDRIPELRIAKPGESHLTRKVIEAIHYFMKETNSEIPITCTDPQAPISVASEVMGLQNLLVALYTHPREIHMLLDQITDYFLVFTHMQLKILENPSFPGFNFPMGDRSCGISICDDLAAVLSPEQYREFCVPYNQRIADEFGGICIHSCGNILHNLPGILGIRGLRAINYHCSPYEVDPAKAREQVAGRCAIYTAPSVPDVGFKDKRKYPDMETIFTEYFIPEVVKPHGKGIIITGFGTYWGSSGVTKEEQDRRYDLMMNRITQHEGDLR